MLPRIAGSSAHDTSFISGTKVTCVTMPASPSGMLNLFVFLHIAQVPAESVTCKMGIINCLTPYRDYRIWWPHFFMYLFGEKLWIKFVTIFAIIYLHSYPPAQICDIAVNPPAAFPTSLKLKSRSMTWTMPLTGAWGSITFDLSFSLLYDAALPVIFRGCIIRVLIKSSQLIPETLATTSLQQYTSGCHNHILTWNLKQVLNSGDYE